MVKLINNPETPPNSYDLPRHSHKRVAVECTAKISPKCVQSHELEYRDLRDNEDRNDGDYICFHCSRKKKYEGRGNPNCSVKGLDDKLLTTVDTELKAYLLGWAASDGTINTTNTVDITLHEKDAEVLYKLAAEIAPDLSVSSYPDRERCTLRLCSAQMTRDICRHLGIQPGRKSGLLLYPDLPITLQPHFVRGLFDGDGSITDPLRSKKTYLRAGIENTSSSILAGCLASCGIPAYLGASKVEFSCNNAMDFLGWIYRDATIFMERKHALYRCWSTFVPGLGGPGSSVLFDPIKCIRTRKEAVLPFKAHASDAGYDLTVIEKTNTIGDVDFFSTGIKVQMPQGWYCHVYPRSSISKSGYMLANSVGIIDRSYMGEIIIALRRCDPAAVDLVLPARVAQLVPMPASHLDLIESTEDGITARGAGGYGSTGT